jgi:hypothetical protein
MAQSSSGSRAKSSSASKTKPKTRTSRPDSSGNRSRAAGNRSRSSASARKTSSSGRSVETVKGTVNSAGDALSSAGSAVGDAAKKVRTPAIAGGAALAGLAGGFALAARGGGPRRVLGVPIPGTHKPLVKINSPRGSRAKSASKDILKAAEEVGSAGRQVSKLLDEVDRVRGALNGGRRRSPVEVVLEGLTSRGRDSRAD